MTETKRMADYLRGYKLEINCIELTKKEKVDGTFQYDAIPVRVGRRNAFSLRINQNIAPQEQNFDWNLLFKF